MSTRFSIICFKFSSQAVYSVCFHLLFDKSYISCRLKFFSFLPFFFMLLISSPVQISQACFPLNIKLFFNLFYSHRFCNSLVSLFSHYLLILVLPFLVHYFLFFFFCYLLIIVANFYPYFSCSSLVFSSRFLLFLLVYFLVLLYLFTTSISSSCQQVNFHLVYSSVYNFLDFLNISFNSSFFASSSNLPMTFTINLWSVLYYFISTNFKYILLLIFFC